MGACHSREATANPAAIEPMKTLPSALSPVAALSLNKTDPPPPTDPSPPSPTITAVSSDSSSERVKRCGTEEKTNESNDNNTNISAPSVVQDIKPTESIVVESVTPESAEDESRRRSSSNSQTPGRRPRTREHSGSQSRPVARRTSSGGVSRAAQLFSEWSETAPAPELSTLMDRAPRTMIINTQQPSRSSDAPLPEPVKVDAPTDTTASSAAIKPMQSVCEEKEHT